MKSWLILVLAGLVALVGGVIALVFPLPTSLAITVLVGWIFLFSGALGLFASFANASMPNRGWMVFQGFLMLVAGVWLLANPLAGMVSLTIMIGMIFVLSGGVRLLVATRLRGTDLFWISLLSGVVSVVVGVFVLTNLLQASTILLATLLAIELISVGVGMLVIGLLWKRADKI